MNVSTSTSAAATTDVNSVQSQAKSENTSKTAEKSFDEEMKSQSKETSDTQNSVEDKVAEDSKEDHKQDVKSETDNKHISNDLSHNLHNNDIVTKDMLSGALNFTDFKYHNESQSVLSQNIQNLLNTKDLISTVNSASTVDYDVINMSDSDANFFANLVQNTDMSMKSIASEINEVNNTQTAKSIQVSSVLMEKLSESLKTNQPFRIDFDKDVSVIIRVNKDGSLAANFIPGDKAVEQYLRNNISFLRQRFDDENLSYSELSYSNSRNQQQQKRKKENDNE